ncbi:hypothetical protein HZH68_007198 [Vespula germanica]|uniref:Uncharacterized protein n=1 Tax=Vespula germanica TaxID=30212 RepID=A0A834K733_VESGE|nr:hypothetical protein HZH68_007198 [Vespula germanica]
MLHVSQQDIDTPMERRSILGATLPSVLPLPSFLNVVNSPSVYFGLPVQSPGNESPKAVPTLQEPSADSDPRFLTEVELIVDAICFIILVPTFKQNYRDL